MAKYIVSRIGQTIIVIILVTLLTFVLINIAPGDPASVMLAKRADEATIAKVRTELGLDRPYSVQYLSFLKGLLQGDLGKSFFQKKPVLDIVLHAMKVTLRLGAVALIVSVGVGLINGTLAAVFRGTWVDRVLMFLAMIGVSVPTFWIAVILQLVLGLHLRLLPISGQAVSGWMIMPVICLGLSHGASAARLVRTNMIEALNQKPDGTAREILANVRSAVDRFTGNDARSRHNHLRQLYLRH